MPFHRQGFQKTIYGTPTLSDNQMQLLVFMATHCAEDLTVKRSDYTANKVAKRLKWGPQRVRDTVTSLKAARLLQVIKRKGLRYYQLPNETQLLNYTPPK